MALKKIVYITNARIPTEKAHGLQIMKSCEAFSDTGVPVDLITPYRFTRIKENPFSYYGVKENFKIKKIPNIDPFSLGFIPKRLAFYIQSLSFSLLGVIYALLIEKKDVIFYSRDYTTLYFLSLAGLNPVAEIHDYRSRNPKWRVKFIFKRAKKIILNSEGTLEALRVHYDMDIKKTLVVPNGVDVNFFDIKESKDEAREILDIDKNKKIIAYIGRLESAGQEKGVDFLIGSFKQLPKRDDTVLYIIGGPDNLIDKYAKIAGDTPIVFTGQVEYKKIPLYLRVVDIVVIPLGKTGHAATTSPMKLFEFMAAGKAIIAPDIAGLKSHLNRDNSLIYMAGDSSDLAEKIIYALNNEETVTQLGAKAKENSVNYSWNKRAERIINFIKK